jgi:hypothetical protein
MSEKKNKRAAGTNGSVKVEVCQVCSSEDLEPVLFLGYLPPVNTMPKIGSQPEEQPAYPAQMLRCERCELVQLGLTVDPAILFPPSYPYTSGTTKILRDNFAELYAEATSLLSLAKEDLVVDIGSNDGTLLGNFQGGGHRVCGIEPTNASRLANDRGITTLNAFFNEESVRKVSADHGQAKIVTAANVFAHIEDVHSVMTGIKSLLREDGVFISESHYLLSLVETCQYDTIYHEHLRYYALGSLKYLLEMNGLEPFHAKRIPTHGGSIRVYAARRGQQAVRPSVGEILAQERKGLTVAALERFRDGVVRSKLGLLALLDGIKKAGQRVYAIGAPSRASTLVNYVGLDEMILDCVLEISGSHKVDKYMPGTLIPVLGEEKLFADQPEVALLLSWHIADELMPKLRAKGFRGKFLVPLPVPRLVIDS